MQRILDLSHISDIVDKVIPGSEDIKNPIDKIEKTVTSKVASVKKVTSDVQSVLKEYCDNQKIDNSNKDFLDMLNRKLTMDETLSICDAIKSDDPMSEALLKGNVIASSKDFSNLAKNAINAEMSAIGYGGTVPDCLFNEILNKINLFDSFGKLSPDKRIALLDGLKSSCMTEVLNGVAGEIVKTEAMKGMINGLMESSPVKGFQYIQEKAKSNEDIASLITALEMSVSEKGGTNIIPKSLALGELLEKYKGPKRVSNVETKTFITNLDNEKVSSNFLGGEFSMVKKVLTHINPEPKHFKNNKLLGKMVGSHMSSVKPTKDLGTDRTTNIGLSEKIGLMSLFS